MFNNEGLEDLLTPTDKKIKKYILENQKSIIDMDIHSLASSIGVSASSISKLMKKLSYSSFSSFKIELAKSVNSDILDDQIKEKDKLQDILIKLSSSVQNSIKKTQDLIDINVLEGAVKALRRASKVYIFGVAASGIVCQDLYYKLSRIGIHAIYNLDTHIHLATLANITKNDVVIGISYNANTKEVIEAITYAKSKKAKTITITGFTSKRLDPLSDFLFKIPMHEHKVRSTAIASRNDSLFIIDLLYLGIIQDDKLPLKYLLEESKNLTDKLKN